jgi:hypothetical protein
VYFSKAKAFDTQQLSNLPFFISSHARHRLLPIVNSEQWNEESSAGAAHLINCTALTLEISIPGMVSAATLKGAACLQTK